MSAFASASEPDLRPASTGGAGSASDSDASSDDFRQFAREGGGEAFRRIVERQVHAVHSTAERVLGRDAHLAADVTQEVFTLLAGQAATLPDDLMLSAWLHRLTVRRALNAARSENRRRIRERKAAEDHAITMDSPETDAETGTAWSELRPHLDQALLELREADRQAILMRFFEDRDLRTIAALLGVTVSGAQKRLSRALDLLRSRLARRGVSTGVALLATLLAANSVRAAPVGLSGKILTASAASLATPASGATAALFITMSHFKGISLGIVLGLCAGMGWNVWSAAARQVPLEATARPPISSRGKSAPELMAEAQFRPPTREASLAGLFSQMRQILSEPDHELTRQRLLSLMAQVKPAEFQSLFDMIRDQCHLAEHERVYKPLAKAWAKVRPEEAMEAVVAVRARGSFRVAGSGLAITVFGEWHDQDPAAARQWLADHSEDKSIATSATERIGAFAPENMIGKVAQSLLKESPEAVIDWATRLEGETYRVAALSVLWKDVAYRESKEDRSADLKIIFDQLASMKDASLAARAAARCAELMSARHPDELERALRDSAPSEPAWQAAVSFAGSAFVKSRMDRVEIAMRLAGDRTPSQAASQILMNTFGVTPELLPWALPLLNGPEREATILHVARLQAHWDDSSTNPFKSPENPLAIQSLPWAAQVSDPAVRDPLIYGIYQRLLQTMPAEAAAFPEISGWPGDLKAILRHAAEDLTPAPAPGQSPTGPSSPTFTPNTKP